MPIYEYRCENCGHELDALQKISDDLLTDCPECNTPSLKKRVSAPGFRLKGGGWYETDFKGKNKKNVSTGEKGSSSADGDSSSSSSESSKSSSDSGSSSNSGGSGSGSKSSGGSDSSSGSKSSS